MSSGISILDLGLNESRLNLLDFTKKYGIIETTPSGLHTVLRSTDKLPLAAIYILKKLNAGVNTDRKNQLHSFYMVYVSMEGDVVVNHLQSKKC